MTFSHALLAVLGLGLSVSTLACDSETPGDGVGGDTAVGGADPGAGGTASGGASTGGASTKSCAEIAEEALADGCDAGRNCNYQLLADHCASGEEEVTAVVLECLRLESSCHTPFDPGNEVVRACLDEVLEEHGSATSDAVGVRGSELCGAEWFGIGLEIFAATGTSAQVTALANCVDAAADCDEAEACLYDEAFGVDAGTSCE